MESGLFKSDVRYGNSPCKDCTERSVEPVNCHMVCERFLEWEKRKNLIQKGDSTFRAAEDMMTCHEVERARKSRRRKTR